MADLTILHNPRCSTSRAAVEAAEAAGVPFDTVLYLKQPLDEAALRALAAKLEDPITDLVRRDTNFKALELSEDDVATEDQVVALLAAHPELLQRPVLIHDNRAIIGRPKDRVAAFLA